jgi:stearoyl-CoA desaturase (delta-9 desaturase)
MIVVTLNSPPPKASSPRRITRELTRALTLGFHVDQQGVPRRPAWVNIITLGTLLPGFSIWAVYRIFTTPTGLGLWTLTAGLYGFALLGVTLGNHRYWTHRGFKARMPLQVVLATASAMSVQGEIQQWVMTHRAHHRYADVVGWDPHTPYEYSQWRGYKGLLWAQGVWLMFEPARTPPPSAHRDLAEDRLLQAQRKAFGVIAVGQYVLLLAFYPVFGWNAVLIAGVLRTAALMTSTGMVNSVCHRWGTRARDSRGQEYRRDDSRNNVIVAVLAGGEGNHSWHHADPTCPRHGRKVELDPEAARGGVRPDRGWRADATWRVIQLLQKLGLVYDVKQPRRQLYFSAPLGRPTPSLLHTHQVWHVPEPDQIALPT